MTDRPTSRSFPGSEGSTSPSKPSASDASDRSSGMSPADESLSDGGRMFPDGLMSESSPLLPTPRAQDEYERSNWKTVVRAARGQAQETLTRRIRWMTDPRSSAEGFPASPSLKPASAGERPTTAGSGRSFVGSSRSSGPSGA